MQSASIHREPLAPCGAVLGRSVNADPTVGIAGGSRAYSICAPQPLPWSRGETGKGLGRRQSTFPANFASNLPQPEGCWKPVRGRGIDAKAATNSVIGIPISSFTRHTRHGPAGLGGGRPMRHRGLGLPLIARTKMRRSHSVRVGAMSSVVNHASVLGGTPAAGEFSPGTQPSPLADAVRAVQQRLGRKAAEQLAEITHQDAKTAQRQMAKGRPPSGPAVFLMATDPNVGPPFLSEGSKRLSRDDYVAYWTGMVVAAGAALSAEYAAVR